MDYTPEQFEEWIKVFWSVGWKGLLIFSVVYYRDLVTHVGKSVVDVLASWLKKR